MKRMKRFLAMMIACVMVILAVPTMTEAADITLTAGSVKNVTSSDNYYKIVVPSEGTITLYAKAVPSKIGGMYSGSAYMYQADKSTRVYGYGNVSYLNYTNSGSYATLKIAVSKGTYYVKSSNNSAVKYTFAANSQPTNYSKAKANTLKVNTKTYIKQTNDYTFSRWFKITLTKDQKVSFTSNMKLYKSYFKIYKSNGLLYDSYNKCWESDAGTTIKTTTLKKGTYYIRVDENLGSYYSLLWK